MTKKTRIYVCGSSSVGKTTLCRELGEHLHYTVVGEAARDVMNTNKVTPQSIAHSVVAKNNLQAAVFREHLARHNEAIKDLEDGKIDRGVVFDRGIDFLVYAAEYSTLACVQHYDDWTQAYLEALTHPESLVLLLEPHEKLLQKDDVRASLNMLTAQKITFGIKCLLEVFGIPYVTLTSPDVLERVKLVTAIVNPDTGA